MYLLPRGANVTAHIEGDQLNYVVARIDQNIDTKFFCKLIEARDNKMIDRYKFASLPMNETMLNFAKSVKEYLNCGINCVQLHSSKLTELQMIFRWYYTPLECAQLFYPMVGCNSDFTTFVLNNYELSTDVEELAQKANMSRSTFDRKFKESFGTTPLKWIDKQTRQKIINKASEPNVSIKDLMFEVGILNPSQFTHLCKRLCGVTPTELIRFM